MKGGEDDEKNKMFLMKRLNVMLRLLRIRREISVFAFPLPPFTAIIYEFVQKAVFHEKVREGEQGRERSELEADKSVIQADSFDSKKRQNNGQTERRREG